MLRLSKGHDLKAGLSLVLRLSAIKCKWGSLCSNVRSAWPSLGTVWARWEERGSCLRVMWAPSELSDEELGAGPTLLSETFTTESGCRVLLLPACLMEPCLLSLSLPLPSNLLQPLRTQGAQRTGGGCLE